MVTVTKSLLTPEEAAAYLGVKPQTLSAWRCTGRHKLPFVRIGKVIRYRLPDLERWTAAHDQGSLARR